MFGVGQSACSPTTLERVPSAIICVISLGFSISLTAAHASKRPPSPRHGLHERLEQTAAGPGAACTGGLGSLPLESAAQQSAHCATVEPAGSSCACAGRGWPRAGAHCNMTARARSGTTYPPPSLQDSYPSRAAWVFVPSACKCTSAYSHMGTQTGMVAAVSIKGALIPSCSRARPRAGAIVLQLPITQVHSLCTPALYSASFCPW